MTRLLFALICSNFCAAALYFVWRFLLKRNVTSIAIAFLCLGWVVAVARELLLLPRDITNVLLAAALCVSLFLLLAIYLVESQQARPFR